MHTAEDTASRTAAVRPKNGMLICPGAGTGLQQGQGGTGPGKWWQRRRRHDHHNHTTTGASAVPGVWSFLRVTQQQLTKEQHGTMEQQFTMLHECDIERTPQDRLLP